MQRKKEVAPEEVEALKKNETLKALNKKVVEEAQMKYENEVEESQMKYEDEAKTLMEKKKMLTECAESALKEDLKEDLKEELRNKVNDALKKLKC